MHGLRSTPKIDAGNSGAVVSFNPNASAIPLPERHLCRGGIDPGGERGEGRQRALGRDQRGCVHQQQPRTDGSGDRAGEHFALERLRRANHHELRRLRPWEARWLGTTHINTGGGGKTQAQIAYGTASSATTLNMSFDKTPVSGTDFTPNRASDILTMNGIAQVNFDGRDNGVLTDVFVLTLSYDRSAPGVAYIMQNTGPGAWEFPWRAAERAVARDGLTRGLQQQHGCARRSTPAGDGNFFDDGEPRRIPTDRPKALRSILWARGWRPTGERRCWATTGIPTGWRGRCLTTRYCTDKDTMRYSAAYLNSRCMPRRSRSRALIRWSSAGLEC